MLGTLDHGVLGVREIHRFANEPVRQNGSSAVGHPPSLAGDAARARAQRRHPARQHRRRQLGRRLRAHRRARQPAREPVSLSRQAHQRRDGGRVRAREPRAGSTRSPASSSCRSTRCTSSMPPAARRRGSSTPHARSSTIPDLLNYWLTGELASEYTVATTTQFIDARTRTWATRMLDEIGLPTRLLQPLVRAGSDDRRAAAERVRRPAREHRWWPPPATTRRQRWRRCRRRATTAFLSSGTWSLLGTELREPVITSRALALNFTNEGGVCGTTRLLKNIGGLWLLQSCRRHWKSQGQDLPYDALVAGGRRRAAGVSIARRSRLPAVPEPDQHAGDHRRVLPGDRAARTRQRRRRSRARSSRAWRSSTRAVLESLEELTGRRFDEIRIVGGGSRNRLLKQWTADATGRAVTAGPAEATALGNIGLQMMATGAVGSLVGGARGHRSVVPGRTVRAGRRGPVGRGIPPVPALRGVHLCLRRRRPRPSTCRISGTRRKPRRLAAHPLELLRYRSNLLGADLRITNFGGGNTSSKFTLPDPLTGTAGPRAGGEGQRRRSAVDRPPPASRCCTWTSSNS